MHALFESYWSVLQLVLAGIVSASANASVVMGIECIRVVAILA